MEFSVILIGTGGLWICISVATAAISWPRIDQWAVVTAIIGVSSIVLGVVSLRMRKK